MLYDIDMMSCHSGPQPMLFRVQRLRAIFDGSKLILSFCLRWFLALALALSLPFWDGSTGFFNAATATLRLLHLPKYLGMRVYVCIAIEHAYQTGRLTHAHTGNLM